MPIKVRFGSDIQDCIIVGGGPAGLTAALYVARFLRTVLVFDAQNGRAQMIPKTHNMAAFPDGISGQDLLRRMRSHAEKYGALVENGTVQSVEMQDGLLHVSTDEKSVLARSVIFASGVLNHRPPLSPQDHDLGLARGLIRYCPVCDAHEIQGKRVAVLGSGQHGFDEASFIRHYSASVTLIPPDGTVAVARGGIAVLHAPMTSLALTGSDVVITLASGETRHFDTLYVALGTTPKTDLAVRLGVDVVTGGYVKVDAKQKTSMDQVYAIGDIVNGLDQIAVGMGQAAIAATAIHNALSQRQR